MLRNVDFKALSRRLLERSYDLIVDAHLYNWELSGSTMDELDKKE